MAIWRYDGSFSGFLTLCATLIAEGEEPEDIVSGQTHQGDLFRTIVSVERDDARSEKMLATVASRMSPQSCRLLWRAFLSETEGVELLLWRYLSFGRKAGAESDQYLAHPVVAPVHRLARAVSFEAYRLLGVLRFRETASGHWYAAIEPAYQVLELIAPHFAARCSDMKWIIHDRRRNLAIAWNGEEWHLAGFDAAWIPLLSEGEEAWSALWREYFTSIAIPERTNLRLQRQHLPERFRRYLTEVMAPPT